VSIFSLNLYFLLINTVHSHQCQPPVLNKKTVNLTSCNLEKLTPDFFGTHVPTTLSLIKNIDLFNNRMSTIGNLTFIQAPALETLDLSNNLISYLEKSAFQGLGLLKTLILDQNHLTTVDLDVFQPCTHLFHLGLKRNSLKIMTSHQNTVLSVKRLNLAFNELQDISAINGSPYLKTLRLNDNTNLSFHNSTFSKNPLLSFLSVSNTGLASSNEFQFLANIKNLYQLCLNRNNLDGLRLENIITLERLGHLQIGGCRLIELDFELLKQKFPQLRTIYKAGNRFGCWHSKRFANYLQENNIEIKKKGPTVLDVDDDMSCVFNSLEETMILILGVIVTATLIWIYFIARVPFVRCAKKSADQPNYRDSFDLGDYKPENDLNAMQGIDDEDIYGQVQSEV
jgi:Leucine rich repeat